MIVIANYRLQAFKPFEWQRYKNRAFDPQEAAETMQRFHPQPHELVFNLFGYDHFRDGHFPVPVASLAIASPDTIFLIQALEATVAQYAKQALSRLDLISPESKA